ncbi:hypothetical protein Peur_056525 [Populus x canadensis]
MIAVSFDDRRIDNGRKQTMPLTLKIQEEPAAAHHISHGLRAFPKLSSEKCSIGSSVLTRCLLCQALVKDKNVVNRSTVSVKVCSITPPSFATERSAKDLSEPGVFPSTETAVSAARIDHPELVCTIMRLEISVSVASREEDQLFALGYGKMNDPASHGLQNTQASLDHVEYDEGKNKPILKEQTDLAVVGKNTAANSQLTEENGAFPNELANKRNHQEVAFVHAGSIVVNIATYLLQNNELFAVSSQDDDFLLSDIGHFHLILNSLLGPLSFKGGAGSSKSEACDVYLPHLIEEQ